MAEQLSGTRTANFKSVVQICCMKCRIIHRMRKHWKLRILKSFNYPASKPGITLWQMKNDTKKKKSWRICLADLKKKSREDIPYTGQIKTQYKLGVKWGTMKVGREVLPPAKQKWRMGDI